MNMSLRLEQDFNRTLISADAAPMAAAEVKPGVLEVSEC
jgi:hypothetical protein